MLTLDDVADVRAGDKGDTLVLAVLPRDDASYPLLRRELTAERVGAHFGGIRGVERTEMPRLPGLVFRVPVVLAGGVTGNTGLDGHGKTLSYHLLTLTLEGDG